MCSTLLVILAVLIAVIYVLKKTNVASRAFIGPGSAMRIVERMYLGPKQSLIIIQAGKEKLLLGITGTTITFLSKLERESAPNEKKDICSGIINMPKNDNDESWICTPRRSAAKFIQKHLPTAFVKFKKMNALSEDCSKTVRGEKGVIS